MCVLDIFNAFIYFSLGYLIADYCMYTISHKYVHINQQKKASYYQILLAIRMAYWPSSCETLWQQVALSTINILYVHMIFL